MPTIMLPDHHLIRHPTVIRRAAAPLLVNGCLISDEGDHKVAVFYVVNGPNRPAEEVFSAALTHDDFARSLIVASVDFLPGLLAIDRSSH